MMELTIAIVAALIAVITSGYALGAVRRRKTILELIEVGEKLSSSTLSIPDISTHARNIGALLDKELQALHALEDTNKRLEKSGVITLAVAVAMTVIADRGQAFIPKSASQLIEIATYVSAAACLVASGLAFTFGVYYTSQFPSRLKQVGAALLGTILLVGGLFVTIWLLRGTPYYNSTLVA